MLFLITKNNVKLIQPTDTKAQETLDIEVIKSTKTFSFDIPLQLTDGEEILDVPSLEVFNSAFKITNENRRFEIPKPNEKVKKR